MDAVAMSRFEQLVGQAMDAVPDELWAQFDNVVLLVEDAHDEEPDLLGVYEGIPLTEREDYGGATPDVIRIFRLPLCAVAEDEEHLVEEVYVTVVHEFAHHLGIDDDRLHQLGWA
ncbi:MAG: metallopeptidase family protein [Nitriliruptor sp.]|nr:MAG: metallopeptidase family protein [Nitriliruptor sp.]TVR22060.1 MAG: metallopeptidase family protein [Nitriliruptor sp.]